MTLMINPPVIFQDQYSNIIEIFTGRLSIEAEFDITIMNIKLLIY